MKVKATRLGFYGGVRIREGVVFVLSDPKHFSDANRKDFPGWMVKVGAEDSKAKGRPGKEAGEKAQAPAADGQSQSNREVI